MSKLGYARVSTHQQSLDLQIKQLISHGVKDTADFLFTDKKSGKNDDRNGLQLMLLKAREGDEIIVTKLDRFGRNTADMIKIIDDLYQRNIYVTFLSEAISTKGSMGQMIVTILAAVAQAERNRILERTREGRLAAVEAGVKLGRKPSITEQTKQWVLKQVEEGRITKVQIAKEAKISRMKVYQIIDEVKKQVAVSPPISIGVSAITPS